MSLRDRLRSLNLGRESGADPPIAPTSPLERGEAPASHWLARFEEALGGAREPGSVGEYHVVRTRHPVGESHGSNRLADFLGIAPRSLSLLGNDPSLGEVALDRVAFLDCETTGLAGGTGTKAFLVGVAYFEAGPNPPAPLPP